MTSRGAKYWNNGSIPLIAPDVLGNIIAEIADVGIVITEEGEVLSVMVNPSAQSFQPLETFQGQEFHKTLTVESVPKFESRLAQFIAGEKVRPLELNHIDTAQSGDFPLRYSLHRVGPDGAILLLGRDLRPVAEMQQQLVKAQLALEQDYEVQREHDTRFRVLMESTSDGVLFVSTQTGKVTEANPVAANLLGDRSDLVIGRNFVDLFDVKARGDLLDQLSTQAVSNPDQPMTLTVRKKSKSVVVSPTLFRVAGARFMLCRITSEDINNAKADNLMVQVQQLYARGPDAIVFASDNGTLLSANESFLDLIGVTHDVNIRGKALADYLLRGSVDVNVMIENTARTGRMRMYATKIASDYGSPRSVEISVTKIRAGEEDIFAFVIRDANRIESSRTPTAAPEENINSVMELVGSATLKEIVAETTNVVEKMCIETAVELTMNNRVAAAEMLGLSRQSLYVKLRKFNLLSRDPEGEQKR